VRKSKAPAPVILLAAKEGVAIVKASWQNKKQRLNNLTTWFALEKSHN